MQYLEERPEIPRARDLLRRACDAERSTHIELESRT